MQSDQNSFRGNVVLGTVNMAFRVDNSILYQIYKKLIYIMMSFNFLNVILTLLGSTQTQYFEFLVEEWFYTSFYLFSSTTYKSKKSS